MRYDIKDVQFEFLSLYGKPAFFTDNRIDKQTIPSGLYVYEVREVNGEPCELNKSVFCDFFGTILTTYPIDLKKDISIGEYRDVSFADMNYLCGMQFSYNEIASLINKDKKYILLGCCRDTTEELHNIFEVALFIAKYGLHENVSIYLNCDLFIYTNSIYLQYVKDDDYKGNLLTLLGPIQECMKQTLRWKAIAHTRRFIGDYIPFTKALVEECLTDMLELSKDTEAWDAESVSLSIGTKNYWLERDGKEYVINYDADDGCLWLYEII